MQYQVFLKFNRLTYQIKVSVFYLLTSYGWSACDSPLLLFCVRYLILRQYPISASYHISISWCTVIGQRMSGQHIKFTWLIDWGQVKNITGNYYLVTTLKNGLNHFPLVSTIQLLCESHLCDSPKLVFKTTLEQSEGGLYIEISF